MITPIIMLTLLVAPWLVGLTSGNPGWRSYGPAAVFAFTGVGHFLATAEMVEMIPEALPGRTAVVLAAGVFELFLAAGLAWPTTRRTSGIAAVAFLILVTPINVYAAWNGVGPGGHGWGPLYLWVRVPLQLILIAGCYTWSVRASDD